MSLFSECILSPEAYSLPYLLSLPSLPAHPSFALLPIKNIDRSFLIHFSWLSPQL